MSEREDLAERLFPESDTTYGYGAMQEAYLWGYHARDQEITELQETVKDLPKLQKIASEHSWCGIPERQRR